ncbi:PAAR domain-containing protein [Vibrio parahaemolyticus]|uniref:PAAR domain-containing protein n=1 Tax=Vibrio parahaemolyticus TaxID=670 RepID=UPI00215D1F06|nr:PAAR domain-containing protein [Vibrio parahaemolyticus]MCR9778933.1 PAAR domain-containing protein [Vibrio parahaemolyticus]
MSLNAKGRGLIHKGDKTSTGGVVTQGVGNVMFVGEGATQIGMIATCPKCKKGQGNIVPIEKLNIILDNIQAALHGDIVACGCPYGSNTLIASSSSMSFTKGSDGNIYGFKPHADIQEMEANYQAMADTVGGQYAGAAKSSVQSNSPEINPNNMYWPPYNFLAKEGEKEIHIRYTQDVVETTVLAPDEWKEFFDALDKTQNIGGAMKGTYDAFDTAKKLGGLGVTAYVKPYNGVDYLILKGYKQHMKTLLAGNRFKASNPQVVKLGLGALDSVKGMARYVKITAPMEILVGSAINVLQYVLNDEYTLKQLGIDEAKLLIGVFSSTALAGGILGVLAVASIPVTFLAGTLIIVGSSFAVWTIDKTTDFQNKIVEGAIENFN